MNYRRLGDGDLSVPEISLGSWLTFATTVDADRGGACARAALAVGINLLAAVQRLVPAAEAAGLSMAQLAPAWVLREPVVASAILGATRSEQVAQNAAASGAVLDDDLLTAVDQALEGVIA